MPRIAKPKLDIPKDAYFKSTVNGRVLAKVVDGKLLCGHRVITNTLESFNSWQEFDTVELAAKSLGAPASENFGCPIIDKNNPPIDWRNFAGKYFV